MTTPRPSVEQALAGLDAAVATLKAAVAAQQPPQPGAGEVRAETVDVTADSATLRWSTTGADPVSWTVGRDGTDSGGSGPWSTSVPGAARSQRFGLLRPGTEYRLSVTPAGGQAVSVPVKTSAPSSGGGGGAPSGSTAAERLGWGTPHQMSDEFGYTGRPDPAKWSLPPDGGWPGHGQRGRRVPECATVQDGKLVLTGLADGRAGWMRHRVKTRYGRWEQRSRSRSTGTGSKPYHVLSLIWPTVENWPRSGEYDWLETEDPDQSFYKAYLHYPHPPLPGGKVEQEVVTVPGVDQREWHHYAFEWAPTHLAGWVDGREVFRLSDGAGRNGRSDIQAMPEGALTLQVDHFGGTRECVYEVEWVRFYPYLTR